MRRIRRADIGRGFRRRLGRWLRNFAPTFRSRVLNLAKTCSMGLRSGEYFGRNTRRAPTSRIAFRTAFPLWGPRLSRITDVAWLQRRRKDLFDIGVEALAVDGPVDQAGRVDAVVGQGGEESRG